MISVYRNVATLIIVLQISNTRTVGAELSLPQSGDDAVVLNTDHNVTTSSSSLLSYVSHTNNKTKSDDIILMISQNRKLLIGGGLAPYGRYRSFASELDGCGATLIHEDIALTAAYCTIVQIPNRSTIWIGGIKKDGSDAEQRSIDYVVQHPAFNELTGYASDIAIIKLFQPSTRPIQTLNYDINNPSDGAPLITIGYGYETNGNLRDNGALREVTVSKKNDDECFAIFNTGYGEFYAKKAMICGVTNDGSYGTLGDIGGPVYDTSLTQVGILSWRSSFFRDPGVYTRISFYETWIKNMTCTHSDNPPSDCATLPFDDSCFSAMNIVEVQDVGYIPISELQIGDYVKSGDGSFTQVYSFGHYNHDLETEFIQIHVDVPQQQTENNDRPLEISSHHLLFVHRGRGELNENHRKVIIPASEVVVGDVLNDGQIVKSIQYITRRGVYSPFTQSGDIIVSNIHASNYVNLIHDHNNWLIWNQHILGYSYQYPKRLFCKYFINRCQKQTYDMNGYPTGAYNIIQFTSIMNQYESFGSIIIVSLLSIPLIMFVYVLETISMISYIYYIVILITIMKIIFHIRSRCHYRSFK